MLIYAIPGSVSIFCSNLSPKTILLSPDNVVVLTANLQTSVPKLFVVVVQRTYTSSEYMEQIL